MRVMYVMRGDILTSFKNACNRFGAKQFDIYTFQFIKLLNILQKIIAFENAFERLLHIVSVEGNSDGGIIVEDCLSLLLNLLRII